MEHDFGSEYVRIGQVPVRFREMVDVDRPLRLSRSCECGCDGKKGVGYLSGGTGDAFFTVWVHHEETFQAIRKVFTKHGIPVFG